MALPTYVIMVRHGERLDESDRDAWSRMRTEATRYDPPLTEKGWQQAVDAARRFRGILDGAAVSAVYSSPTSRTMATAAAIAKEISISSVSPAYGLNCCAAAKQNGVASRHFDRQPTEEAMGGVAVGCWPPIGDASEVDRRSRQRRGFVESVMDLAASHAPGEVIVLVTHREGLWEILRHTSGTPIAGYCCTRYFQYTHDQREVENWETRVHIHAQQMAWI